MARIKPAASRGVAMKKTTRYREGINVILLALRGLDARYSPFLSVGNDVNFSNVSAPICLTTDEPTR